jgi:hypothetical protein
MPSIAESKRQVTEGLSADYEHDAILASLQDEIDKHIRETEEIRKERPHKRRRHRDDRDGESSSRRDRHLRFRFKSGVEEPKPKKRSKRSHSPKPASPTPDVAHPFPREPTDPDAPSLPSNTLFDALADDEAASYWESVYSQPIHVYSRPVQQTESGELQDMDDETYAAYVQRKMWEKQNPEIVFERERMERKRKEEKEAQERRREEFVRARQKEAWDHAGRARGSRDGEDDERPSSRKTKAPEPDEEVYTRAWAAYLSAWDTLVSALKEAHSTSSDQPKPPSRRIPWPTLQNRPATRPNIEAFMRHAPPGSGDDKSSAGRLQALKVERVRWHPDKVQQRFAGAVDESTMKVVTGVFQVVDSLVEEERKKAD